MKKIMLTSFACKGREDYNKAQLRLIRNAMEQDIDPKILHMRSADGYCDEYLEVPVLIGEYPTVRTHGLCPDHTQTPYAFKLWMIQECRERSADVVIWCDSTIIIKNHPMAVLEHAAKYGVCAVDNEGYPLKDWISDLACERLGIDGNDLEGVQQIMGCVVVFDFTHPTGVQIFNEWLLLAADGGAFMDGVSNRPGFKAHRHDQAVLSALLAKYDVPLLPYGVVCYEEHLEAFKDTVVFLNKGLG